MKKTYFIPDIPKRLQRFFDKYEFVISELFRILKTKKSNAVDAYYYSEENPPPNPSRGSGIPLPWEDTNIPISCISVVYFTYLNMALHGNRL
jgi:hypothetical protein